MGVELIPSASRPGLGYWMAEVVDGVWCHDGEGCERERFAGPYNCRHSKDMMEDEMTQALTTTSPRQMAQRQYSQAEIDTIKNTIAQGCTDEEVALFIAACQSTDLNPFAREIYAIRRRSRQRVPGKNEWTDVEKMTIQIGVDGYRKVAASSGLYAGQEGPYWSDDGVTWTDVWLKDKPPKVCKVIVHGHGFKTPVTAIGRWDMYVQTNSQGQLQGLWKTNGPEMLAKCVEVLALRRAFPSQMQGLETNARAAGLPVGDVAEVPEAPALGTGADSERVTPPADAQDGEYREVPEELPGWEETEKALRVARPGRRSDDHDVLLTPDGGQGYVEKYAHEAMKSDELKAAVDKMLPWEGEPRMENGLLVGRMTNADVIPEDEPPMTIEQARAYVRNTLKEFHKNPGGEKYAELCRAIVNVAPGMRKDGKISATAMTEHKAKEVIEIIRKFTEPPVLDPENPTCCPVASAETMAFAADGQLVCKACGTLYPA
jgi:phage recombination protein Bet